MAEISSLSSLLKRLEAATAKLEDLAMVGSTASDVSYSLTGSCGAHAPRGQLSQLAESASASSDLDATHSHVHGFDELLNGPAKAYYDFSKTLGGLVEEQANYVRDLFALQREMIVVATLHQKPLLTSDVFRQLLEPIQRKVMKVIEVRDKNCISPFINHLTAVADGIPALGWVAIELKPTPFVAEMKICAQFYANRVLKDWKEKDQNQFLWARAFMNLLTELQYYVCKFHITGLAWNPKGTPLDGNSLKRALVTSAATYAVAAALAPPAPAPPPVMLGAPAPFDKTADNEMSAVFAQLNQGEAITAGLRKVDKRKRAHKNPELRTSSMVTSSLGKPSSTERTGPGTPLKPASLILKKPPKLALEGNKWVVGNFENNNEVILDQVELNQSVYIYGCKNSTIQIKNKVATIAIDSCTKTGLCMDSLTSLDLVNSKSVQVQILGRAPTVNLDKIDSCMLYLSKECLDVEIITSKCSAVNILTPETTEDGNDDFVERPVPEQFLTKIVDGKIITTAVEHSG
ncbi:MAG: adenylate cyclase associated N terminal-domain-containing protein [Linnemannia elongata]|nr:MAG: adenylate cyclase associated N terminal-domain-containing protein [Linnemannia elongata]